MRLWVFLFSFIELALRTNVAFALTDSVLCKLPYEPGVGEGPTPRPRLVLVEGVSRGQPMVSFYGHQTLPLSKAREKGTGAFLLDAPSSRYLFKLDPARLRLVVALKTQGNGQGRAPGQNEGVAGNCSPL